MTSPRLPLRPTDVNALRDRGSQEREEMLQSLSICAQRQPAVDGKPSPTAVRSIAHRACVTEEAIYHQCDGQTISNPLVDLCAWLDGSLAAGKPDAHALAPLAWLIRRYQPEAAATTGDLVSSCSLALSGVSSVVSGALEAISADGAAGSVVTADEKKAYRQNRLALDRQLAALDAQMDSAAKRGAVQ